MIAATLHLCGHLSSRVEVVSSWKVGIDPPTLREVPCFHSALGPANYVASLGISLNFLV